MVLTTIDQKQAPEEARYLLTRIDREVPSRASSVIIEMVTTIMVYKEVLEEMLNQFRLKS